MCWCAFLESAWCPVWDPRRQPGAWGGAAAGRLARILAGVCARAGQTRIGDTGGSYPDRERARSNPHRGHGRVKSETGKDGTKKKKPTWGCWFLPAAFNWGFNQGFYWAAKNLGFYPGFYLGLVAPGFYLGKNLGRSPGVGICRCIERTGLGGMIDEVPLLQERAPSYAAVRDAPVAGASPVSSLNSLDKYVTLSLNCRIPKWGE